MKSSIVATIPFDFKGEHHTPSVEIDLDELIDRALDIPSIYSMVATRNQIGLYSYEHEVLMSSDIIFSEPKGIARNFFDGNDFDLEKFKLTYHEQIALEELRAIARRHLDIDDLDANQALKDALLDSFHFGKGLSDL